MAGSSTEKMKKLIEEKKNKGSLKDLNKDNTNKANIGPSKAFKKNKKAGSLNK